MMKVSIAIVLMLLLVLGVGWTTLGRDFFVARAWQQFNAQHHQQPSSPTASLPAAVRAGGSP